MIVLENSVTELLERPHKTGHGACQRQKWGILGS